MNEFKVSLHCIKNEVFYSGFLYLIKSAGKFGFGTFTEEILNGKLLFLCGANIKALWRYSAH